VSSRGPDDLSTERARQGGSWGGGGARRLPWGRSVAAFARVAVVAAVLGLDQPAEVLVFATGGFEIKDEILDAEPEVVRATPGGRPRSSSSDRAGPLVSFAISWRGPRWPSGRLSICLRRSRGAVGSHARSCLWLPFLFDLFGRTHPACDAMKQVPHGRILTSGLVRNSEVGKSGPGGSARAGSGEGGDAKAARGPRTAERLRGMWRGVNTRGAAQRYWSARLAAALADWDACESSSSTMAGSCRRASRRSFRRWPSRSIWNFENHCSSSWRLKRERGSLRPVWTAPSRAKRPRWGYSGRGRAWPRGGTAWMRMGRVAGSGRAVRASVTARCWFGAGPGIGFGIESLCGLTGRRGCRSEQLGGLWEAGGRRRRAELNKAGGDRLGSRPGEADGELLARPALVNGGLCREDFA
jgi:hypothetical protein